jgi:hypothetical protein
MELPRGSLKKKFSKLVMIKKTIKKKLEIRIITTIVKKKKN